MTFSSLLPRATTFAAAAATLAGAAVAQDECAVADPITPGVTTMFDNTGATFSAGAPAFSCGNGGSDPLDLWYTFTATASYNADVSTCGSAFDTRVEVYSGDCMNLVSEGCNDDSCGLQSSLNVDLVDGTTYFVRVAGFSGGSGMGNLDVSAPPAPPFECVDAAPIVPGDLTAFDTTGATESAPDFSCAAGGGSATSPDVWLTFTATADYMATVTTCDTASYDTKIEVYSGDCGMLVSEACNDDDPACAGFTSTATLMVTDGTQYWVRIGGYTAADFGPGEVLVTAPPPAVANDECSGALPLMSGVAEAFDNSAATNSSGAPDFSCGGTASAALDIWYTVVPTQTGTVMVDTFGSSFDTRLEAYEGDCGALVSLDCNDDSGSLQSMVSFSADAGQTYYIRVAGFSGASGAGVLNATFANGFPNDDCAGALPVGLGSTPYTTVGATDSGLNISCAVGSSVGSESDVFFSYTAATTCTVVVDTLGSEHDTTLAAYSGDCGMLTEVACDDDFFGSPGFLSQMIFEATAGETYIIQCGTWNNDTGPGSLNISILDGPGIADAVCVGVPNSTGEAGTLRAEGSLVATDNDLTFEARCLPGGVNGLLVNSIVPGVNVMNAGGGVGTLCIASFEMGRHPVVNSGAGAVSFMVDTAAIPNQNSLIAAIAGDTIFWQFWYRDVDMAGAPTSNFTGAVSTTFE